jgi:site-specific DNA-methyltransferase (adenine-specific)/modification methylase
MKTMPDKSVDCVITSPPYNMNLWIRNGKYCSRQIVKEFSSKYEGYDDNLPVNEFYSWQKKVMCELLRVSPLIFYNIAIVTGSKRAFFRLIGEFNEHIKDVIVWDKINGQPAMQQGVLNRQSELILVFSDDAISRQFKSAQFGRGVMTDTWKISKQRSKVDKHSAVFPEELIEIILNNFTEPNDIIYDPFSGSGTTGSVCKRLGRGFIGSELSEIYCKMANERIKATEGASQ